MNNSIAEAEIQALIEERAAAVRRKDADAVAALVTANAVLFDLIEPLQNHGAEASRKRARDWFGSFEGGIGYEISELVVSAGDEIGFSHCLCQVKGTKKDGGTIEMWWRATTCFQNIEGAWRIVHEHGSVPFDMNTGQASLGLKP